MAAATAAAAAAEASTNKWCAFFSSRAARSLLLGQVISFLIAVTGICSTELAKVGFNAPLFQSLFNYVLLACTLPASWVFRAVWFGRGRGQRSLSLGGSKPSFFSLPPGDGGVSGVVGGGGAVDENERADEGWDGLHSPWWVYLASAVIDVEANFAVVLAYQYTSVTSVMLLDCFTIPSAMALSYAFLAAAYSRWHVGGVVLCLGGLGLLVYSDLVTSDGGAGEGGSNRALGDALTLVAAFLYACSNVLQEALVKRDGGVGVGVGVGVGAGGGGDGGGGGGGNVHRLEFLTMLGGEFFFVSVFLFVSLFLWSYSLCSFLFLSLCPSHLPPSPHPPPLPHHLVPAAFGTAVSLVQALASGETTRWNTLAPTTTNASLANGSSTSSPSPSSSWATWGVMLPLLGFVVSLQLVRWAELFVVSSRPATTPAPSSCKP